MSITLNQQPPLLNPAYNELIYLISSSNQGQPNFRFVFDVLGTRVKVAKRPSDNRGLFDASRIVQSFLSQDLGDYNEATAFFAGVAAAGSPAIKKYSVQFGEEYGATPVVYPNLGSSDPQYAWHGGLDWEDFPTYNMNDFIMRKGVANGNFLTNAPMSQKIEILNNAWAYQLVSPSGTASAIGKATFTKYNAAGSSLGSMDVNNINAQSYGLFRLPTGPANINALSAAWIDSNVDHYTVQIFDSANAAVSKLLTYSLQTNCRFETRRLHFLNQLGGIDSFNFILKSRESRNNIERAEYKKRYGSTSGTSWSYGIQQRGTTQFDTRAGRTIHIISDWLSEAESAWLEELILSPAIWLETSAGLLAVNINQKDYEIRKKVNDKLFQIDMDILLPDKIRQRA